MEILVEEDLESLCAHWDEAVEADTGVDPFCSRSSWQLCFHRAFAPSRQLWFARGPASLVALAETRHGERPGWFEPLENMWGLASSLVGPGAAALLARALLSCRRPALIMGLPLDRDRLAPLMDGLSGEFSVRAVMPTQRFVASLDGGIDGWLSRRSGTFRRNLRAALRRAESEGIRLRWLAPTSQSDWPSLYDRVLGVESRSWKGRAGAGVDSGRMEAFYRELLPQLLRLGQLRLLLAERDDEVVGYLHGAQLGAYFRGLQFSFDERFRSVGLGNVMQRVAIDRLCESGVREYDLGSRNDYKQGWAEGGLTTCSLILQPR